MNKNIYLGIGFVALVIVAVAGLFLPAAQTPQKALGGVSAAGTTFGTAKVAAAIMSMALGTATNTSIQNTDATDRIITDTFVTCNTVATSKTAYSGAGLANLIFRMATTATAIGSDLTGVNTNYIGNYSAFSTTTPDSYAASSTEGVIPGTSRVWPTNTYLTIAPNATNTATCLVGAHYLSQ